MAREHNVILQQDRPQNPATCPTTNQQPANRTINLNHNL